MQKSPATTLAMLVAGALCAASSNAAALTCSTNEFKAPADGATNVPTNTLIWAHGGAAWTRLVSSAGEVPVEERFLPAASGPSNTIPPSTSYVPVLRPLEELEPNTWYSVLIGYDSDGDGEPDTTESISFETGSGPLTEAPPPPRLISSTPRATRYERRVELQFEQNGGILLGDSRRELGDVTSIDDMVVVADALRVWRDVDVGTPLVRWITMESSVHPGIGDCLVWPDWPENDGPQSARFGVLDVAGNFSGWSSDIVIEVPSKAEAEQLVAEAEAEERAEREGLGTTESSAAGCTLGGATPRGHAASLIALGVALMALRRRFAGSTPGARG